MCWYLITNSSCLHLSSAHDTNINVDVLTVTFLSVVFILWVVMDAGNFCHIRNPWVNLMVRILLLLYDEFLYYVLYLKSVCVWVIYLWKSSFVCVPTLLWDVTKYMKMYTSSLLLRLDRIDLFFWMHCHHYHLCTPWINVNHSDMTTYSQYNYSS